MSPRCPPIQVVFPSNLSLYPHLFCFHPHPCPDHPQDLFYFPFSLFLFLLPPKVYILGVKAVAPSKILVPEFRSSGTFERENREEARKGPPEPGSPAAGRPEATVLSASARAAPAHATSVARAPRLTPRSPPQLSGRCHPPRSGCRLSLRRRASFLRCLRARGAGLGSERYLRVSMATSPVIFTSRPTLHSRSLKPLLSTT